MIRIAIEAIFLVCFASKALSIEVLTSNLCAGGSNKICSVSNLHAADPITFKFDRDMSYSPENIIFRNCSLPTIPQIFNIFPKIKVFIMKKCGLRTVQRRDFEHARSVQLLVLKDNSIEDLTDKVFYSLIKLEDVRLSHNYLFHLHPNTFFGLEKLKYLDLSYNKIREIPAELFSNLISLEYIDLQFNKIEKIDSSVFEHNSKLQTILLNNNRIIVFEGNSVKHLPRLHLLDVSHNVIDEIYIQSVNSLKANNAGLKELRINGSVTNLSVNNNNLKGLYVSDRNLITKLELHNNFISSMADLDGMRNLAELDLSNNPLENLDPTMLAHSPNLVKLNLSATYVQNITTDTFLLQEELIEIDLSHNRLLVLNPDVFLPLRNLQKLHIGGNNLLALNFEDLRDTLPHLDTILLENSGWNCSHLSSVSEHLKKLHINLNSPLARTECRHRFPENVNKSKSHHSLLCNSSTPVSSKQHTSNHKTYENLVLVLVILIFLMVLGLLIMHITKYIHVIRNSSYCSQMRTPNSVRLQEETDAL